MSLALTCCWSSGHRYDRQTPPQNNPVTWSILLCVITLIAAPPFPPHLQGATKYGTISKSRFNSILTTTFGPEKGFFWTDAKLNLLNAHYGTGSKDLNLGGHKLVAWMDVCEDLGETDASFPDNAYAHGQVTAMAFQTHL